jgi:hypothetical protein
MSFGQYSTHERPSTPHIEVKSKKRLAHVFRNPAHVWANPRQKDGSGFEQTEAWNSGKNFYFKTSEDDTRILYSYRDSYPVASRFVHKKKPVYLVRSGTPYSITTSGHMRDGSSAVPHNAIKFSVPYVTRYSQRETATAYSYAGTAYNEKPDTETHKANLADIISRIVEAVSVFNTAKSLYRAEAGLNSAKILTGKAREYSKLFGLKLPKLPAIPALTKERKDKLEAFDAARQSRADARTEARNAQWQEQRRLDALSREEKIAAWRAGSSARFWNMTGDGYALLRVKGSNVETSQGVSVSINGLAGAGRLLRFLTACKNAGRTYQRNGHTEHIGNFTVESFSPHIPKSCEGIDPSWVAENEAQGTVKSNEWILTAGCHRIKWSEVESIREAVQAVYKPEIVSAGSHLRAGDAV